MELSVPQQILRYRVRPWVWWSSMPYTDEKHAEKDFVCPYSLFNVDEHGPKSCEVKMAV